MAIFDLGVSAESLGLGDLSRELGDLSRELAGSQYPGGHMLGSILDYPNEAAGASQEIQYARVYLHGGDSISKLAYYYSGNGSVARLVRLGLYAQANPQATDGIPVSRIAQTNIADTDGTVQQFRELLLTNAATGGTGGTPTPLLVPVSGYYWLAFVTDNGIAKYAVTPLVRANFAPVRRETTTGVTLPAAAGALANPASAIVFSAAVQA